MPKHQPSAGHGNPGAAQRSRSERVDEAQALLADYIRSARNRGEIFSEPGSLIPLIQKLGWNLSELNLSEHGERGEISRMTLQMETGAALVIEHTRDPKASGPALIKTMPPERYPILCATTGLEWDLYWNPGAGAPAEEKKPFAQLHMTGLQAGSPDTAARNFLLLLGARSFREGTAHREARQRSVHARRERISQEKLEAAFLRIVERGGHALCRQIATEARPSMGGRTAEDREIHTMLNRMAERLKSPKANLAPTSTLAEKATQTARTLVQVQNQDQDQDQEQDYKAGHAHKIGKKPRKANRKIREFLIAGKGKSAKDPDVVKVNTWADFVPEAMEVLQQQYPKEFPRAIEKLSWLDDRPPREKHKAKYWTAFGNPKKYVRTSPSSALALKCVQRTIVFLGGDENDLITND